MDKVEKARHELEFVQENYPHTRWFNPITKRSELIVEVYKRRLETAEEG